MKRTYTLLLTALALMILITCVGCRSGKKVNTNSSGIIKVISPSDLIKQPNGTYTIKPAKLEMAKPQPLKEKTDVSSHKTKPKVSDFKAEPAKPNHKKPELTPIKPNSKLPPLIPNTKDMRVKMNVIPNNDNETVAPVKNEEASGSESTIKIKWLELIMFYALGFLTLALIYVLYDIYKEWRKGKLKEQIDRNLTEPAIRKRKRKKSKKKRA